MHKPAKADLWRDARLRSASIGAFTRVFDALGARSLVSSPRAGSQDEAGREQRVLPLGRVPPRQRTPPRTTPPNEKAPRETRGA